MHSQVKIVFTDLDGTLLNGSKQISPANLKCLQELGERQVVRVIATGRSLYSFDKLELKELPMDFLIFSTGAGVLELRSRELLHSSSLSHDDIARIATHLIRQRVDFMVHHPVPLNHIFTYHRASTSNPDFDRRINLYKNYATRYSGVGDLPQNGAQIIAIFPEDIVKFNQIRDAISDYQVIRTTSPLDGSSMWMEVFPPHVSKGKSARWLCNHLNFSRTNTLGIGNDYNDLSLLDYTEHSYVVANAPAELRRDFRTTYSNDDDGFFHAAQIALVND